MASKPKNYAKTNNNPKTDKYVQVREHPSRLPEVRRDLRPQGRQEQQKGLLSLNQTTYIYAIKANLNFRVQSILLFICNSYLFWKRIRNKLQ